VFPRTAPGDSVVYRPEETIELDMAGPSMEPTDEMDISGPVLRVEWKPPRTYAKIPSNVHGYRDKKHGKKK
jgi:hypothetical protein